MPTQRRATPPQRRFRLEALAALDRDARRKLVLRIVSTVVAS